MGKWQPGESGNPAGRPRRDRLVAELLRKIGEEKTDSPEGQTRRERLLHKLWDLAQEGDLRACRLVMEYTEGRPAPRREPETAEGSVPPFTADEMAAAAAAAEEWEAKRLGTPGQAADATAKAN